LENHVAPVMDSVISISGENRFASEFSTPVGIFSPQASLTASGETPNPGAAPGGSDASVGDTSTMTERTSPSQHIGPSCSDRTNRMQVSKPYQCPTINVVFLETINAEGGVPHYVCRLCHAKKTWKRKGVLRHMSRDKFGLSKVCEQWYVFGRWLTLVSIDKSNGDVSGRKFYTKAG